MPSWLTLIITFLRDKAGPYGVAVAVIGAVTYLATTDISDVKLGIVGAVGLGLAITYFLARNTHGNTGGAGAVTIFVQFGNQEPIELKEGLIMAYELSANNGFKLEGFTGKDRLGNPVVIESPQLTLSSEGICEIRTLADGSQFIIPVALGDVQLQLKADPIPGPDVGEIFGHFDIKVVTGAAVTVEIIPGAQVPVGDIPTE